MMDHPNVLVLLLPCYNASASINLEPFKDQIVAWFNCDCTAATIAERLSREGGREDSQEAT